MGRSSAIYDTGCSTGSENLKTAPYGTLGVTHSRPPWASMIERLIDSPIPMPSSLVV